MHPFSLRALFDWKKEYLCHLLLVQTLLAILFLLNSPSLWLDEAYSALMARLPVSGILSAMRYDAGPPFYYILLHLWRMLLGESATALRLLSLFFSLLTTIILYAFGRSFFSRPAAICAGILWISSSLQQHYALEVRNYTLFAFLTVTYTFFLARYIFAGQNKHDLWVSSSLLVLIVYTHNLGWFIAAASGFTTFLIILSKPHLKIQIIAKPFSPYAWGELAGGFAIPVLLYLPWIPVFLLQNQNSMFTIDWVRNFWTPLALLNTFQGYIPGNTLPSYVGMLALPLICQFVITTLWLLLAGLLCWQWKKEQNHLVLFIILVFVLSLLFPYLYSFLGKPVYLAGRTDFALLPFWCLISGYAISLAYQIPPRMGEQHGFTQENMMAFKGGLHLKYSVEFSLRRVYSHQPVRYSSNP